MKVAHLISSGGLFGAEKVMLSLATNMNNGSIKSWVVPIENVHNPHLEVIEMAKKENIPVTSIKSRGRLDLKSVSYLCDFIKRNNIDIIHTHNYKADFLGLLAAKKTKIPIVATVHGYGDYGINIKLKVYREIDRFILRYFNKVVLVENSLRKWFKNSHVKYEVINNGVCLEKNKNNDKSLSNDKQNLVIGTVGRLSREKGHKFLLEAMKKVLKHNSNIELLMVGEGNLKEALKKQAEDLGISEKVIFAGYQNEMHKIYPIIDIVVHPSLREGLPLALLEAMAFEKAIVATGVGGVGELIKDGVTGLLIKSASSQEITRAVLSLLANTTLRERLGENARSFVMDKYSIDRMVNKYKVIYRQVANLI